MKKYILILAIAALFLNCGWTKAESDKEDIALDGIWKIDSVLVYEQGELSDVSTFKWFIELTSEQILYCGSEEKDSASTYWLVEMDSGEIIFHVDTEKKVLESQLLVRDEDHFILIYPDSNDTSIVKHWYHGRTQRSEFDRFCKGQ